MDTRHVISSESGFSLIEVLVALTIFAIGLLALAGMQMTAIRGNSGAQSLTSATSLAEGTMEWLQSLPADDPLFDATVTDQAVPGSPFDLAGGGSMVVTYSIDTSAPAGASASEPYPDGVVRLTVKVDRPAGSDINLETLKWVR